jgi:hypothetical protein
MLVRYSLLSLLFIYLFWCTDAVPQVYSTAGPVTDADFNIIRIKFDYRYLDDNADAGYACYSAGQSVVLGSTNYTCTAADVITNTKRNNTIQIIDDINNYFVSRIQLKTVRVNGNLVLDPGPDTCGYGPGAPIPASYKSPGVAATDLLVFVTARPVNDSVSALSAVCQRDQFDRSIAAQLNVNMQLVEDSVQWRQFFAPLGNSALTADQVLDHLLPLRLHTQFSMLVQELVHVLGFTVPQFSSYRTQTDLSQLVPYEQVINSTAPEFGPTLYRLVTPRALDQARTHFGCPNMLGIDLEAGLDDSLPVPYFEKRLMFDEVLTLRPGRLIVSPVTLGLLQDMGWYRVNYAGAQSWHWGRNAGCNFVLTNCATAWLTTSPSEALSNTELYQFGCAASDAEGCSYDHRARSYCNLKQWDFVLDPQFRHYSNPNLGGGDALADFCPYFTPYTDGDCTDYTLPTDQVQRDVTLNSYGEMRCPNCRCLLSTAQRGTDKRAARNSGCFATLCAVDPVRNMTQVHIRVGGVWYPCWPGRSVKPIGFTGDVYCPTNPERVCSDDNSLIVTDVAQWPALTAVTPAQGQTSAELTVTGVKLSPSTPPADFTVTAVTADHVVAFMNPVILDNATLTAKTPALSNVTWSDTIVNLLLSVRSAAYADPQQYYLGNVTAYLRGAYVISSEIAAPLNFVEQGRVYMFGELLALSIVLIIVGSLAVIAGVIVCAVQYRRYNKSSHQSAPPTTTDDD